MSDGSGPVKLSGPLWSPSGRRDLAPTDDPALAVRAALARDGIAHFQGSTSREDFFEVCQALGVPWTELFVFSDPTKQMFVRNPRPVRFHTDSSKANLIAWYCVQPCSTNVPNLYLDAWDAYAKLEARERELLESIACPDPLLLRRLGHTGPMVPIVQDGAGGRPKVFWLPDRLPELDDERASALARFGNLLAGIGGTRVVRVRLALGQFVVVDNNRFLHGRAAIPPDSPRMLYRLWINTDGWPSAADTRVERPAALDQARTFEDPY